MDPRWDPVHLVGIGGAGMSAIARVLQESGRTVSGSDSRDSAVVGILRSLGIRVHIGHHSDHVQGARLVIASTAVPADNAEIEFAEKASIPVMPRGEALARIVQGRRTIAVGGTHGKTTTCGMIATVLETSGADPTYLVGADISQRGAGAKLGAGSCAVVEADEAYGSFLHLKPSVAVITNLDDDHLDHYGTREALEEAFASFMGAAGEQLIVCGQDSRAMALAEGLNPATYGFEEGCDFQASDLFLGAGRATFRLKVSGRDAGAIRLRIGGRHNVLNALGAISACITIGLEAKEIARGLEAFKGMSRRFEYRGTFRGAHLVDDYAHHPAEIEATLSAARTGPWKRVLAVFQPHLFSRTHALFNEFATSLSAADVVVVTDVYGAREDPIAGVTGKLIVEALCDATPGKTVGYMPRLSDAALYVRRILRPGDLVLTLGAGDITTLPERLAERSSPGSFDVIG